MKKIIFKFVIASVWTLIAFGHSLSYVFPPRPIPMVIKYSIQLPLSISFDALNALASWSSEVRTFIYPLILPYGLLLTFVVSYLIVHVSLELGLLIFKKTPLSIRGGS
ncbi:MAG: hypothetical protein UY21_C0005G0015 [Microgenomates group bacterium GW2011_GWA1_48_10]|uniref:Uncharacterized protein n=1 Tax=Candidatus Gottesmanbacteria bacterium RIFCSPHIGHO2_01_FULL_47_48 TaxID=1798381 RepID=A0A1F6A5P6_9BACT|nr:MAG: hypothetical protein UY21_C0005G0015 [Microgenomates group bacterium GW2011_GWA1_48_10]OGG19792.1 MAG: hypothetical protein A2721_01310 [Candidatus Gottesmanbacteria bacterium RIFCSPHIGHO2_01_FULL_47_48]